MIFKHKLVFGQDNAVREAYRTVNRRAKIDRSHDDNGTRGLTKLGVRTERLRYYPRRVDTSLLTALVSSFLVSYTVYTS